MWLRVSTPSFSAGEALVRIVRVHGVVGQRLARGQALVDLTVDMSAGVARDCPPVSTCRVILREDLWLRALAAAEGEVVAEGALLARLSEAEDEPEATPAREARVTVAAVLDHADWWAEAP